MALVLADRVKDTTTTAGTGTITLANSPPTGFQSFATVGDGNTTYYTIAGQGTSEWEVGIGTYTSSGTTLSRDIVFSSSAGGTTKVTFSAGTKDVFVTLPSQRSYGIPFSTKSTTYTASPNEGILADTSGGPFTITLPASPVAGTQVIVGDAANTWGTNNLTLARNGSTIEGAASDLTCDITGVNVQLIYSGTTWQVFTQAGGAGGSVDINTQTTGTLTVSRGGTGATTLTGVLKGNGTSAFTAGTVSLTTEVSGTLPVANGGTGAATLSANAVLLGNGTSALQTVAPGTSGNVLTSNGTTWASTAPAGGGSWVLLASVDASNSATVSFESGFDTTKYDEYVVVGENVLGSYTLTSDNLLMDLKIGGSYRTSSYSGNMLITNGNGTTTTNATLSTPQVFYQSSADITQKTGALGSFEAHFFGFQDLTGVMPRFFWTAVHPAGGPSGGYMRTVRGGGGYILADYNTFGGVRFYYGNGNISTGRFRLYGIKKT